MLEGEVIEILDVVIMEIKANPTQEMGWFNHKLKDVWRLIFPLTEESAKLGTLPFLDPAWGLTPNPWWLFLMDEPLPEEERKVVWQTFPQISPNPILCEINPLESLSERRMLVANPIATLIMVNRHCTKLIQVFKPTMVFNLLSFARVLEWELWSTVTLIPGKG